MIDSDEESISSPPPPSVLAAVSGEATGRYSIGLISSKSNPVLRLPTRWSEQDRQTQLSITEDGRELSLTGELVILFS